MWPEWFGRYGCEAIRVSCSIMIVILGNGWWCFNASSPGWFNADWLTLFIFVRFLWFNAQSRNQDSQSIGQHQCGFIETSFKNGSWGKSKQALGSSWTSPRQAWMSTCELTRLPMLVCRVGAHEQNVLNNPLSTNPAPVPSSPSKNSYWVLNITRSFTRVPML